MKRYGNLWQQIITKENFELAEKRAKKRKGSRRDVIAFEKNLEKNLEEVRQLVVTKQFHTSPYKSRKIYEPKERVIYILPYTPDRIVQHAIMNILVPIMEKLFIVDSYACIANRGQIKASHRTMEAVRRNKYCLKCDIHHFYPSINQSILSNMYHNKFKDKDFLEIIDDIIFSFPGGYNCPIGNYTSQWSGNFYLTPLDWYCKQKLKIRDYIRYCDDFLLFGNDKAYLHDCRRKIEDFIGTNLELTYSKADVFNVKQGIDFCGYRYFDNYILVRKSTAKRQMKTIKRLPNWVESGKITTDNMRSIIDSTSGWLKHANAYNLKQAMKIDEIRGHYIAKVQ
jgi:retron-type reverse transcriptase